MWSGELRSWIVQRGQITGRIYQSFDDSHCGWGTVDRWYRDYHDGTFITVSAPMYEEKNYYRVVGRDSRSGKQVSFIMVKNLAQTKVTFDYADGWMIFPDYWKALEYCRTVIPRKNVVVYRIWTQHKLRYTISVRKPMSITEDNEEQKDANVVPLVPKPKLSVITGGRDNTGNWLLNLKEGSVFLCRHKKDDKEFILVQFHIKKKWSMAVWLHSNFPMHQSGDYFVHSLKFSQQHDLVELQQDGDDDGIRGQDEEGRTED